MFRVGTGRRGTTPAQKAAHTVSTGGAQGTSQGRHRIARLLHKHMSNKTKFVQAERFGEAGFGGAPDASERFRKLPGTAADGGPALFFRLSLEPLATVCSDPGPLTECNGAAIGIDQAKRPFGGTQVVSASPAAASSGAGANRFRTWADRAEGRPRRLTPPVAALATRPARLRRVPSGATQSACRISRPR